jgi:hypothetical protein
MSLNPKVGTSSSKLVPKSTAGSSKDNPKAGTGAPKDSSQKVEVVKRPKLKVGSFAHRARAMEDKIEKERKQRIAAIARGRLRDEKAAEKAAIKHQKLCDKLDESDEAWYNATALDCGAGFSDT